MAVPYERLVEEDLHTGYGTVSRTMPAGGTASGTKIGLHTFMSSLNVRDFGAQGDGVTDDTAAIQATLDRLAVLGGGTAYFPKGTYLVRPSVSGGVILTLDSTNLRLTGQGVGQATIKVADSSGPYRAILQGTTVDTDLSNLTVDYLTFDHNIDNNALPSQASIEANPEFTVAVFAGTDIRFDNLQIKNASSLNNLVANGTAVARVTITHCVFSNIGDDPNHVAHDASLIYTSGPYVVIAHNQFISAGQDSGGAVTAIETHSSSCVIADNVIVDFLIGMNVTGIESSETHDITINGNTLTGGCLGIRLWSAPYLTHTTGYGLNGVTVTGNVVKLAGVAAWPTTAPAGEEQGIGLTTLNDNLDATGIVIANNVISYPLEAVAVAHNAVSLGIGWVAFDNKTLSNSKIANNTILNFPLAGIRLSCALDNVEIAGNLLVNCGSTLSHVWASTSPFRASLLLISLTLKNVIVRDNAFRDTLAEVTWRPGYFVYLFQDGTTVAAGVRLSGNTFLATGSAMTAQITQALAGGLLQPYLEGATANFVPTASAFAKWALGSHVVDTATGLTWTIGPDQSTWSTNTYIKRIHSAGTPLAVADVALTGWGAAPVVTVAGEDQGCIVQITCGVGPTVNPNFVVTFKDGTFGSLTTAIVAKSGGNGADLPLQWSAVATTLSVDYIGTPVAGQVYQFSALVLGRPL